MTVSAGKFPGYYTLKTAYIYSAFDTKTYRDISGLIPSFQIVESIKNDCIRGSATVFDSVGMLEEWPLRGEENLYMTVEDALGNETSFTLYLYKVDGVRYDNENNKTIYTIHFVSRQRHIAGLRRIIKSYEKPASDIVQDIFREYRRREVRPSDRSGSPGDTIIDNDPRSTEFKDLVVEPTQGIVKCIIPNFTPMQAFRFLAERSLSNLYKSCSYRFFERTDGFYYVTDEYLMKKAVDEKKIFQFTSTAIPRDGKFFQQEMDNFSSITSPAKVNAVNDITDGSYKSQAIVLDILYGVANIKQNKIIYDYNTDDYFVFENESRTDKHNPKWVEKTINEENCKKFLIVKDYDDKNGGVLPGDKSYPEILLNRNAFFKQQESLIVNASGHGRLDITCGDVVKLNLAQTNATGIKGINKHLYGTYLVQEVIRTFENDVAVNSYTLVKREWAEAEDV